MLEKKGHFQTLSDRQEEEKYFYERDLELVRRQRDRLDQGRRQQQQEQRRKAHWMRCPKCGARLIEQQRGLVVVDICGECGGIFLDKGELDMILRMDKKDTFIDHLSSLLDRIFTQGFDLDGPSKGKKGQQREQ